MLLPVYSAGEKKQRMKKNVSAWVLSEYSGLWLQYLSVNVNGYCTCLHMFERCDPSRLNPTVHPLTAGVGSRINQEQEKMLNERMKGTVKASWVKGTLNVKKKTNKSYYQSKKQQH